MSKRVAVQEAFKLALSMTLMFWLALAMDWDMPSNGGVAILLVSLGTAGASFNKGVLRLIGTTIGVTVGFLAVGVFGQSPWGTLVFFTLYLLVVGYLMQMTAASYALFVAGFVPLMVWSSSYASGDMGTAAFQYGSFRYLETSTGILIYTVVSVLFWPIRAGDGLPALGAGLWSAARESFRNGRADFSGEHMDAEEGADDPAARRAKLDGLLAKFTATLQAAYGDTSSMRRQRRLWEVMRVNLRGLVDALDLWQTSVADCREFGAKEHLEGVETAMERLDQRFARIAALWSGDKESTDEDRELFKEATVKFVPGGGGQLSRSAVAAAEGFVMQWNLLDRLTCELLRVGRVLAGLDSELDHPPVAVADDRACRVWWDPARLVKALFPALCFATAFVLWILFDLPGGASVPSTTGAIVLNFALARMDAGALAKLFMFGVWICVAPIYFWVMPALDTGAGLLTLIFVYTFLFGLLGAKKPMLKLVPILMFVNMTGISNQQSYSFMGLMNGALMLLICFTVIVVLDMLWAPTRPEQVLTGTLRRFFRGCAGVVAGFAPGHPQGMTIRKRYFDSMMRAAPGQVGVAAKALAGSEIGGCDGKGAGDLLDGLQAIILRLQAVEVAHQQLGAEVQDWREAFAKPAQDLCEFLQDGFLRLALLAESGPPKDQGPEMQRIFREFSTRLDAADQDVPAAYHAMLGSTRGLLGAINDTRRALGNFDWHELGKARF